jgi:hypothetical protein
VPGGLLRKRCGLGVVLQGQVDRLVVTTQIVSEAVLGRGVEDDVELGLHCLLPTAVDLDVDRIS